MSNIYQTPQASLGQTPLYSTADVSHFFRRRNWFVMMIFTSISLYFYLFYWIVNRAKSLNKASPKKISMVLTWVLILTMFLTTFGQIANAIFASMNQDYGNAASLTLSTSIFVGVAALTEIVLLIVWSFTYRARLNELILQGALKTTPLSGVMTFLFNVFYIQYKINVAIDNSVIFKNATHTM